MTGTLTYCLPAFSFLCFPGDTHRWTWTVSADALPHELEKEVELIEDFLRRPLETFGETYASMVQRVRKTVNRPIRKIVNEHGDEEEIVIKKGRGRRKEKQSEWVDNDFIEDSDEELEIVAKLIAERGQQEGGRNASPSSSSTRARSRTGSSTRQSSPPSSSNETPKQKRRSKGLFLGSDDEDEEDDDDDDDAEEGSKGDNDQSTVQLNRPVPRPLKRTLMLSDDDEDGGEEDQPQMNSTQVRKRRALIDDEDE